MEQAKLVAKEDQVSVNQLFWSFIAEGLGHQRGLKMMRERAARADVAAALAVLDGVPPLEQMLKSANCAAPHNANPPSAR